MILYEADLDITSSLKLLEFSIINNNNVQNLNSYMSIKSTPWYYLNYNITIDQL